ncbi:hypothetical protein [Candidatus Palauibacter sp.]|uniref:hypothetical protein n=1 Tax=Candidatus Palauibacter sp. TaxID=3101350 RepID=UPI003CC6C451
MIQRYGIDTSGLVRLLTGVPEADFTQAVQRLSALVADEGSAVVASNQVIGEAYIAVQHHYGVTRADARGGLLDVLRSGLVAPLNGRPILDALEASGGPGLLDRLIANDYAREDLDVLTLDKAMATLPRAQLL